MTAATVHVPVASSASRRLIIVGTLAGAARTRARTRAVSAIAAIGILATSAVLLAGPACAFQPPLVTSPRKTPTWAQNPIAPPLPRATTTHLRAAPSPLPDTTDPFILLGLDPSNPTADKKEIKRAYKRQAMRYHPDVVISSDSTPEERKRASEEFAKINAAYEILSGKGSGGAGVGPGKSGAGSRGDKGGSGSWAYQPPHRRSGASSSSSYSSRSSSGYGSGASTDWRDYMPNYDEEDSKYDAGDDSFSKIFSDLMSGVAAGAAGAAMGAGSSAAGGGILRDLIDFLEGNVADGGGFGGVNEDDSALSELLIFGSLDEVANEMDDTQLLVQQLETKIDNMEKDTVLLQEEVRRSMYEYSKYTEKIELEERLAEVEARKGIVSKYLKKARKRLVKLQARYKELIVEGRSDRRAGTGGYYSDSSSSPSSSRSSYSSSSSRSSSYGSSGSGRGGYGSSSAPASPPPPSSTPSSSGPTAGRSTNSGTANDDTESASFSRSEGFGSFGRRGGSGTRGRSRRNRTRSADSQSTPSPPPSPPSSPSSYRSSPPPPSQTPASSRPSATSTSRSTASSARSSSSTTRTSSITTSTEWTPPVPPHRRTGPDPKQLADDKKRLRDIKVDEDFEKLKREMGF
jgi:hypothetical protein